MKSVMKFFTSLFNQKEEKRKAEIALKEQEEKAKVELARKEQEEKVQAEVARKEQEKKRKAEVARKEQQEKEKAELARKEQEKQSFLIPLQINGIYWAVTGYILVDGKEKMLLSCCRFYENSTMVLTTFIEDDVTVKVLNKFDWLSRGNTNFLGTFKKSDNKVEILLSNKQSPIVQSQGFHLFIAMAKVSDDGCSILMNIRYPFANDNQKRVFRDGEFIFKWHEISFTSESKKKDLQVEVRRVIDERKEDKLTLKAIYTTQAGLAQDFENFSLAIEFYSKALSVDPNNGSLYALMGVCKIKIGDTKDACNDLRRAINLGEDNEDIRGLLEIYSS